MRKPESTAGKVVYGVMYGMVMFLPWFFYGMYILTIWPAWRFFAFLLKFIFFYAVPGVLYWITR